MDRFIPEKNKFYAFQDIAPSGIPFPYLAYGIIISFHLNNDGTGDASGKHLAVQYINHIGKYEYCWREITDVNIYEIDEFDYHEIKDAHDRLERN